MQQDLALVKAQIHDMIDVLQKASKTDNANLVVASLEHLKQCLDFLIE